MALYFIVIAFIIAAIVTPPDVVSQLALAIPMCLLYELGIIFARFVTAPPPKPAAADAWGGRAATTSSADQDRS